MNALSRIIILIITVYVVYILLLAMFQRHIIYPGRNLVPPIIPSGVAANAESFWIITTFGKVEGRLIAARGNGRRPFVIFFHGNGELVDDLSPELEQLRQMDCGLLLVEYPGYGHSSGRPHQRSLEETALSAYDALIQRPEVDVSRIVAFGVSLGSAPALTLAVNRPIRALILAAPLTSLRPFGYRRLFPSFLLHDTFDNIDLIKGYEGPMLVLHGQHDEIIPFSHGQRLSRASVKSKLALLNAGHNDLLEADGFWKAVRIFLGSAGVIQVQ